MKRYAATPGLSVDFDDFLRAPIGEGNNGIRLSVLSAFARLGMDPWQEAARLSGLPTEAAVTQLSSWLTSLPDEPALHRDPHGQAVRLMGLLRPSEPAARATPDTIPDTTPDTELVTLSVAAVAIVLFLLFTVFVLVTQDVDGAAQPPASAQRSTAPQAAAQVHATTALKQP